jgi:hypothetical protein
MIVDIDDTGSSFVAVGKDASKTFLPYSKLGDNLKLISVTLLTSLSLVS